MGLELVAVAICELQRPLHMHTCAYTQTHTDTHTHTHKLGKLRRAPIWKKKKKYAWSVNILTKDNQINQKSAIFSSSISLPAN